MNTLNKIFTGTEIQQKQQIEAKNPNEIAKTSNDINKRLMEVFGMDKEKQKEQYVENQLAKLFGKENEMNKLNKSKLSLDNVLSSADDYFLEATG